MYKKSNCRIFNEFCRKNNTKTWIEVVKENYPEVNLWKLPIGIYTLNVCKLDIDHQKILRTV